MAKKFNAEKALAGIENGGVGATTEVQNAPTKVGAKRFNAEKALAGIKLETPESKERAETMMSIGKLNRDLMGGQLAQMGKDIPDFTNKWTYDYLMSDEKPSTEVDAEAQMYRNPLATEEALTPDSVVVGVDVQKPLRGANLQDSIKSLYDTENEDFLSSKRAVSSHIVDKYEVDKDGFVTIGEQRMPRAQAEMIMQDIVEQTMHPTMMQKNKAYRDNWFIGNTGMNAEDYLRNLDANLASLQQELNTEVGKDIDAIRSTTTALQMAENAGIDPAIAQAMVTNERYGGKAIRDMRDQIQSILNNDFGSGLKEGFDTLSMISAGLNDLVANVELGNVLNKVYNDKPLTEREKIAYEAYMIGNQINELEDLFGGRSWWNEVGQGVGASGEMAVGFAAGMGAVGKLGKFANLPIRATLKSVRRAAKNDVWDAIKMAGIRGAQLAGRSLKNVAMAEGAGLIAAPMLPSTYASLAEKRNGQYAVENGKLIFKPTKAWKDVIDTWIESGTEIGSELIGARIGEVLGGSARAFGRMLSLDKIAAKAGIGKHSNILFGWEKPAAFKAFERSVGFQGAVAEPLSEIWGDATANMLKGIITGNGEFAQFRDVDYWTKTLATCAIYGGSLQVASAPHAVARYANIARYGRERKRALSRIKIAKLHDDVSAALAVDNIDDAAKAFAQIDWGSYSLDQRAYAMDAIRADYAQRVAIANQVEDGRMTQFLHVADRIEDMEYRGMDGLTPKGFIKTIVDKDGVTYTAIQGGKGKPFYICLDANGNKVSIPTANIEGERNVALGDVISQQYDSMYSVESEQERQRNIVDRYNDMRKGESSAESVKRIMSLFGVKQYRSGDDVTLVNGETATVEEFIPETGEFIVSLHNGGMETLPFYNVLSESTLTADAQKLNNASTVNANVEQQIDAEERSAEVANEPRTTRFVEGDIVVTPTGANARVREVNEDGTYEVDYNTEEEANPSNMILENYAEADLRFENEGVEVASTEVVPQEIEVAEIEQTAPESNADATMPEAKPIPQNEDGTINYDAIDDVEQFATLYEREVGGRENATQDVADMRDSAQEDLLKSIEKGKKMRNANEKVANRREQQALAERVAFYNNVLDILAPAEQPTSTEETAPVEQTTNEVQTVPSQSAEAEGKQTGLITNEYSEQLTADFAASLDAVAKAFGLRVMFVPLAGGGKANAEIDGNEVRIAWKYRGKAIQFLVGHEFTHRMQDLSPEEYNAFKGAVIKYLGEEAWNARIAEIKETYDKQAVAYTDTLIEDEAVADFVGELIEDADSFDLFIAQNAKESWFKRLIEALKALFSKLSETDVKTELYNDVLDKLGAMVSKATEVATKEAEVSESTERLREQGAIVDAERGDVRLSVADVLTGDQREQAIADLMRVTGRSRRTVLSYLKAEESLANIILSGDNATYLDYEADDSVPSIWENSDYPQGTVEFSNICRKRLPLTMIYQKLQKEFPNTKFNKIQLETIRQTLIANGVDVACGLCFVEDRRQHNDEIGQGFIDALSGKDVYVNANQQKAIDKLRESGDNYIPNLYELLTLDGMKKLRMEHPDVANAFIKYNNARGQQAGRLFQAYSAYHREILKFNNARVKKTNDVGGLRIFSFSDFEAHHLIDLVQVLTDCAAKGIKVQGYTKVPEFALAVKDTNMKLNRSLIAKDNGVVEADYSPKTGEAVSPNVIGGKRLLLDTVEGIDVTDKNFFDSSTSKNVGNILVGVNDEQIRIAMLDPFVDYIIPFHTGLSADILKQKGISDWKNYKYEQIEKTIVDGKMVNAKTHINIYTDVLSDDIKTEKQFVERYLEVCKEKNLVPKFARFLNRDKAGDFVYAKGYYKFLLDFKMFDAKGRILPQEVVQPIFNDEVNKQILDDYVKGEKAKAPNDELYGKVVDAMVERGVLTEAQVSEAMQKASAMEGVRFSLSVMRGLSDALNEYKVNGDIATFVEKVREVNDKVALGHPKIEIILALYEEDGDAEWFAEKIAEIVADYDGGYAPYTAGGVRYHLSNPYGGNSGYVGYSMSKRAAKAREEGRYPKSDFKKVYDMPQATLDALVNAGVINDKEWHHTSVYGNKTTFYGWGTYGESPYMSEYYKTHKTEIDEVAKRHGDLTPFLGGFEEFEANVDANNTFIAQLKAQTEAERERQRREEERLFQKRIDEAKREIEDSERKRAYVEANLPTEFVASNGVTIKPKGYGEYPAYRDGEAITSASSSNKRKAASKARAEFKEQIIAPLEGSYASQSEAKFSLRDIPAYEASAEVSVMLGGYKSKQITLNGLIKAVENIAKKYSKTGLLKTALEEYENGNTKEFIDALEAFVSIYPSKVLRDYSGDKATIEETFGGIWIEDAEEFAKFVSAVNTYPTDENGEGIAKTSDYLYLYYRGIGERIIPFASVYLNKGESQNVANELINAWNNGEKGKVREYIDGAYEVARDVNVQGNILDGTDKELSATRENDRLGSELSQLGRYYYTPELYSKVKRADNGSRGQGKVNYSLITPEMDATYLDAVERGDMATVQRMVMEAAKLAMPNTKVVDEGGNPKVVYHQTNATVYINRETGQNWDELDWRERMEWDERDDWDDYWEEREFNTFSRVNARTTQELDGFFFAPEYDEYHEYGNRTISAFLDITNPASFGDYNIDSSKTNAGRDERIRLQNEGYDGVINEEDGSIWEYIAFNPNQIKSADPVTYDDNGNIIPLSERFNPEKEDIRFSLIGEIGAANLEEYGRYSSPMLALEIARELEADGKSALEIRVATNWERGKDGKWRYEIADGEYIHPSDDDITSKVYRLKDILNNPDLYKAYPNLADVKVKYDPNMKGYGMFKGDTIKLNSNTDEAEIFSTLIHEVQHAIQLKEMFAVGGNVAEQTAPFKADIAALEKETKALAQEFKRTSNIHLLRKGYLLYQGLRRAFEHQMLTDKGYESYRTLAGEVEARNVQKRHNMSEEERLNTLLTATEDVARDSQRVIFHEANVGKTSSPRLSVRDADMAEPQATEEEYKEAMLIKAQELERTLDGEKLDIVQEIADQTGWVRVDNDEWEYYGIGEVALTSTAKEKQAVLRWMQAKRAVRKARVRNMYWTLITEAYEGGDAALVSKYETERAEAIARINAEYADKIEAFEEDATPFIKEYYDSERWSESKNIVNDELRKMRKKMEAIADKERTRRIDALGKREAVAAIKTQINNLIRGDLSRYMRKRDIQAIMKAVNDSQSAYAMLQSVDNAMRTIYQLRIRKEMERMNNLTKMRIVLNETNIDPYLFLKGVIGESAARKLAENYWRGVNSNGVNVEKGVDADTAAVMQFIHDNIDYKKVKGGSEIFNVSEYISSLEAKINEDVTLDAEMKTKKIEALPMIADYLEIQQMMDDFEVNYNRTRMRSSNIAELTKKITTLNNEIKALESTPDKVIASDNQLKDRQKALLKARKELRSEYRAVLAERIQNDDMYFGAMPQIVERLYQANKAIEDTLRKGRLELSLHKSREEALKKEIINDALKDMDGYAPTTDKPVMQRVAKVALGVATKQFHSLDYLTREMAKYSTNGEGRIWRRFAPTTLAASNNIQANMRDIAKQMDDKAESLFDMSYVKMRRLAERTQIGTYPVRKFIQDGVDERGYMKGKEAVVEMPLYVCQALDILATWGQENGRQSLEKMGFDEGGIDRITRALDENNPQWREYSSWVINSLLPSRRPKLNAAHKKVFGAPMAAERNYFPIRRDKDLLHKDEDIANDGLLPLPSVVTGSVIARTNSTANIDLNMSFFDVLEENLTETEAWSEMAPIIKDLNILLSSTPVKLAMKNIREDFVLEFRKAAKVATLNYTSEYGEFDKWVVPMINKAWATNKLALKGYTALKQLAGTLLFLPYAYDPRFRIILASRYLLGDRLPILMIVGDAEENMKKLLEIRVDKLPIIGNVMWAMEHSVNYRNRVLSATAGNETFAKKIAEAKWHDKNWATDVRNILDKVMNYSMLMIAGVDAFTVAGGMRAIYDYETLILNTPKEKAMLKAEFYANKTQQSAEPLFLSPMQQSRSFFAQSLSTFQNAPIAQGRIVAESLMNLIRNSSKTAMNTVNMKIEDMVAAQLQEEDAGNVMSTQQRGERAREIEKQIRETEFEKLLKDALSEVKASKKTSISPLLWNAYLAPLAFNLTSILPYLIFGDDEDRKKDLVKDVFAWSWAGPFASIPVLSHLIQAVQGYDFSLSGAYDNFTEDVQNIIDHIGDKGIDWGLAGIVLDNLSRRFLGIDYQTVLNVAQGIDSMIEDGYSHEALMKLINAPDSQIRLLAGERREGETVIEYTERILRLYSIGEYSKYEDYFNEKGQYIGPDNNPLKIRAYRAKRLLSEYNEAYTRNVVRRFGERGELSAMAENDAEYTERAKSLNWSAEATPSHTQNIIRGEYRAPLEDLAVEGYAELAVIQEQIAHLSKNIKRFAGTDEQYYEMVELLDSLKVNFKIKYDELIK